MKLIETKLEIGLDTPVSVLHISDTHFCLADERNDERKLALAKSRTAHFGDGERRLSEPVAYARAHHIPICHTGDFCDFVSEANLDRVKEFIDENDVMFIAGNHEFSLYVGEAFEDEAYRNQSLAHVQSFFKGDIRFNARVIGGVNFVGIDNGYYRFEPWQIEALRKEVAKGLPIVLYMHDPLYSADLYEYTFGLTGGRNCCLVGTPEERIQPYQEEFRKEIERPDAPTREAIDYIKEEPLIKAILTGHIHHDYETMITDTLPQYVTGMDTMRLLYIY